MNTSVREEPHLLTDLQWRLRMSANLRDLTAEVKALCEVVMAMNEKLAASEAQSQDRRPDDA